MGSILGKKLALNTALLTASSLAMRCLGMIWQVWLAGRIGAAGIGLFQLVSSVGMLFSTLAISGIHFATTRLLSEEIGLGRQGALGQAVRRCLGYAAFFGAAAGLSLFLCAEPMGFLWVGDARTVRSLRYYALSLPALGISSVLAGYFTAVGRVWKSAGEQLFEQLLRMALTALLLHYTPPGDLEGCCAALVECGAAADWLGCALSLHLYRQDRRRYRAPGEKVHSLTPRLLRLALPLAFSSYARSALNTLRQLWVPRGLRRAGLSADAALSGYGIIGGMALPVLLFPTALLTALSELLIPALTEAQVAGKTRELRRTLPSLLGGTLLFSLLLSVFFYSSADALSHAVYGSGEAAPYIRRLAPLLPFLYTDIITDACLKGLGQMMRSMAYNITVAALGLSLVWVLLPRYALNGYVALLYICEIFDFFVSLHRLYVITRPQEPARPVSLPQSSSSRNCKTYPSPSSVTNRTSSSLNAPVSRASEADCIHSGGYTTHHQLRPCASPSSRRRERYSPAGRAKSS